MMVVKPPNRPPRMPRPWFFLAGSIEMGTAADWQGRLTQALSHREGTLWNPRREHWDSSWEQRASNPKFREQVGWELDYLEDADKVVMYFDPATKSPITLLELGLLAHVIRDADHDVTVCCPDGFWRKGNVEIICERYRIQLLHTFDDLMARIKETL